MKTIDKIEAMGQGMKSLTLDVMIDSDIYQSIEKSMQGIAAAWVRTSADTVQLFRRKSDLSEPSRQQIEKSKY
jgi:hypothetical protein